MGHTPKCFYPNHAECPERNKSGNCGAEEENRYNYCKFLYDAGWNWGTKNIPTRTDVARLQAENARLRETLERAKTILSYLTVGDIVLKMGGEAIDAAGLNEWCINEGLAESTDSYYPDFINWALDTSSALGEE